MKDNQHEQLFTELTPVEASVVEGGKGFSQNISFDDKQSTQAFTVSAGGTIELFTNTTNYLYGTPISDTSNPTYYVAIRNVNTGNKVEKIANVGKDNDTTWTNVRAGTYVIDFRDANDDIYVNGPIGVYYS